MTSRRHFPGPLAAAAVLFAFPGFAADVPAGGVKAFEAPEDAWRAFVETMKSGDWNAVEVLLGPAGEFVPPAARTAERLKKTAAELERELPKVEVQGETATWLLEGRPFPVCARKTDRGWVLADNTKARVEQEATLDRLHCLSNLKLIQLAAAGFERKRQRTLATLEALTGPTAEPFLQPSTLLCPAVVDAKHRLGAGGVACDYLHIPSPKAGEANGNLYAFCPKWNHPGGGRICVFRDGTGRVIEDDSEFRALLKASLDAAGISLEPPKEGSAPANPDSPSVKPRWRNDIRRELGLDGPAGSGDPAPPQAAPGGETSAKPPESGKP